MKKYAKKSVLLGVLAILLLFAVGSVGAQDGTSAKPEPTGTAVRINFELAPGHSAKRGHYSVQLPGGAEVASWYALDGWVDSGWISDLEIKGDTVLVHVLYYPGPDTTPTALEILNPAPGTDMGWLGEGMAHALEVAWPDMPMESEMD
jgi:hypothetical protein